MPILSRRRVVASSGCCVDKLSCGGVVATSSYGVCRVIELSHGRLVISSVCHVVGMWRRQVVHLRQSDRDAVCIPSARLDDWMYYILSFDY